MKKTIKLIDDILESVSVTPGDDSFGSDVKMWFGQTLLEVKQSIISEMNELATEVADMDKINPLAGLPIVKVSGKSYVFDGKKGILHSQLPGDYPDIGFEEFTALTIAQLVSQLKSNEMQMIYHFQSQM